ncbi:ankyrin repeat domain-containing protein [Panacagrimonas perspica]|uniref:ankyrin repeat domain-containing protein n=1 Tax=Panacagrimonas perspica TaxID=381431 RepID=UPI00105FD882
MARALRIAFVLLLVVACSSQTEQQRIEDYVALIEASESGQPAMVEALLTRGTPVDAVEPGGPELVGSAWAPYAERPSPLFVAAANGHLQIVKSLLRHGPWLDWRCCDSFTPLGTAAANGHREIVEALLAAGADPSLATAGGKTPLEAARANGHEEIALVLERAMGQRK